MNDIITTDVSVEPVNLTPVLDGEIAQPVQSEEIISANDSESNPQGWGSYLGEKASNGGSALYNGVSYAVSSTKDFTTDTVWPGMKYAGSKTVDGISYAGSKTAEGVSYTASSTKDFTTDTVWPGMKYAGSKTVDGISYVSSGVVSGISGFASWVSSKVSGTSTTDNAEESATVDLNSEEQ